MGKRMGSALPKVLIEVAGRPMVWWVVQACRAAGAGRCILVVSQDEGPFREALGDRAEDCLFVNQRERLGTAHAAQQAQELFAGRPGRDVFVLAGDGPLVRARTLQRVLEVHRRRDAAATMATSVLADPTGYGRVLRDAEGGFDAIVEQKDADERQRAVCEVNPSYYCFRSDDLFATLPKVSDGNEQGEYYLTDVPGILKREGRRVCLVDEVPPEDVLSINTPQQLAQVERILRSRR